MAEIAFETLNCQSFGLVSQASLQLFASMRHSGLVVDFGADMT